jgi:hypothetical protein
MGEEEVKGKWESLPDSPIFVVHAAVMHTRKVLLFSGGAEVGLPLESRVWDPVTGGFTTQIFGEDLFCSGHAFLADGRLCVAGGAPFGSVRTMHLFDPVSESWSRVADMSIARWYPTVLTLPDGRILSTSGVKGVQPIEIYDHASNTWQTVSGADHQFDELYPSLHLLPSGDIFYSRAGWDFAVGTQTAYLKLTGPHAGVWTNLGQQQFPDRKEGTAVIMIDSTSVPARTRVLVVGGGDRRDKEKKDHKGMNPKSCEMIDLTTMDPPPVWKRVADMHYRRTNVNAVLLPDGTVFVVGGRQGPKWEDPKPVYETEIYDPKSDSWIETVRFEHPKQYHSIAVLLPDGSVLAAGGIDSDEDPEARDQRFMEKYSPPYLFHGERPIITNVPDQISYNSLFEVITPDASNIDSVTLLHPCATTHHTDANQRYIKLKITQRQSNLLTVKAPNDSNLAPPGHYMLFVVNTKGVPSIAKFVRIKPELL